MSDYLRINGLAIPTSIGGAKANVEIGDRNPAYDGSARKNVRATVDRWPFETTQQEQSDSRALEGLINGEGHVWPYDTDLYSSKGLGPTGTPVATIRSSIAADGKLVDDESAWNQIGGSVAVDDATTNLIPSATADPTSIAGFTAVNGSVLAIVTGTKYINTSCLEATTDGIGGADGYYTDIAPATPNAGEVFTGTIYILSDTAAVQWRFRLMDITNATNGSWVTVTFTEASVWYRVEFNITIGGADCNVLRFWGEQINAAGTETIYSDALQIENLAFSTSWVDGSRGSPSNEIDNVSWLTSDGAVSWAYWTKGPHHSAGFAHAIAINDETTPFIPLVVNRGRDTGANDLQISWSNAAGVGADLDYVGPWDGDWHHIGVIVNNNPSDGKYVKIFYDGSEVASHTAGTGFPIEFNLIDEIHIGKSVAITAGIRMWGGLLDDFIVAPYAMLADQFAGIFNFGKAQSALPFLIADGDFTTKLEEEVLGEVPTAQLAPYVDGSTGTWHNNAERLRFILRARRGK